jgi:hypothetical protein
MSPVKQDTASESFNEIATVRIEAAAHRSFDLA